MSSGAYSLRLARTLYENVYHAMLYNENQQPIGDLVTAAVQKVTDLCGGSSC